jgi:hypothetical protein
MGTPFGFSFYFIMDYLWIQWGFSTFSFGKKKLQKEAKN